MADRVHAKTVTCPASTPIAAAIEVPLVLRKGRVERIEVRIPGGHAFLTGIALLQSHGQTIPFDPGDWLIGDDDRLDYTIQDALQNGAWSALVFNTDPNFAHSWLVRFSVLEDTTPPPLLPARPIDPEMIHQLAHHHAKHHQAAEHELRKRGVPGRAEDHSAGRHNPGLVTERNVQR